MDLNLSTIFDNIHNKINKNNELSLKIKNKIEFNNLNLNNENLELLLSISKNINKLNDELLDLYELSLKTSDKNTLSISEKEILRNNKINKIINETFYPFMLYSRLSLENSIDV